MNEKWPHDHSEKHAEAARKGWSGHGTTAVTAKRERATYLRGEIKRYDTLLANNRPMTRAEFERDMITRRGKPGIHNDRTFRHEGWLREMAHYHDLQRKHSQLQGELEQLERRRGKQPS